MTTTRTVMTPIRTMHRKLQRYYIGELGWGTKEDEDGLLKEEAILPFGVKILSVEVLPGDLSEQSTMSFDQVFAWTLVNPEEERGASYTFFFAKVGDMVEDDFDYIGPAHLRDETHQVFYRSRGQTLTSDQRREIMLGFGPSLDSTAVYTPTSSPAFP